MYPLCPVTKYIYMQVFVDGRAGQWSLYQGIYPLHSRVAIDMKLLPSSYH